jgi:hypothetical protein
LQLAGDHNPETVVSAAHRNRLVEVVRRTDLGAAELHTGPEEVGLHTDLEAEERHIDLGVAARRIVLEGVHHIDLEAAADIALEEERHNLAAGEERRIDLEEEDLHTDSAAAAHHTGLVAVADHILDEVGSRPAAHRTVGSALVAVDGSPVEVVDIVDAEADRILAGLLGRY